MNYNLKETEERLKTLGYSVVALEDRFKTTLADAVYSFKDQREAQDFLNRADHPQIIDRRMEYPEDQGTNWGGNPITWWKKECCYCKAPFETTNRTRKFCNSPGHRQRYYEQKKAAQLFLEIVSLLNETV